jgi:hypothetical protein
MQWLNDWKTAITLWVMMVCLTAIICAAMLRNYRYQAVEQHGTNAMLRFDKSQGRYVAQDH